MKTIIEMTRELGGFAPTTKFLEQFAELVRADEREAWEHKYARLQSLMEIRETQPNKPCCLTEREAILELVDRYAKNNTDLAEAIRARGNT